MCHTKILTLHPQEKKGVRILKRRYDSVKDFFISTLNNTGEISYQELDILANHDLKNSFDGKISWYIVTIKLD